MNIGDAEQDKVERALLCLGDADVDAALKTRILGQPLVFHLIKNLQLAGLAKIALSVETVPPELPALVDRLRSEGLDIALLRNGPEAMEFAAQSGAMLLQNAAIWVAPDCLARLVEKHGRLVVTLPEDPKFAAFERIDLNRRWAGLAVVDGSLARQANMIADGWSIDSCLLRTALQAGYPDMPLIGKVPADTVVHARMEGGQALLAKKLLPETRSMGAIERLNVRIADVAIQRFSGSQWWDIAAIWTLPLFAALAGVAAYFGYGVGSFWLGAAALFVREIRRRAMDVAYRQTAWDKIDLASAAVLWLALYINLRWLMPPFDAAFLSLGLFGLSVVVTDSKTAPWGAQASPFVIGAGLALLATAGLSALAVKLAILALVAASLAGVFAGKVKGKLTA